jgi:hypothetical protein
LGRNWGDLRNAARIDDKKKDDKKAGKTGEGPKSRDGRSAGDATGSPGSAGADSRGPGTERTPDQPTRPDQQPATSGSNKEPGGTAMADEPTPQIADPNGGDQSLVRWTKGVEQAPAALEQVRDRVQRHLAAATLDHPMSDQFRQSVARILSIVTAVHASSEGWAKTIRQQNAADFAAYETPRDGSHTVESRSDVTK